VEGWKDVTGVMIHPYVTVPIALLGWQSPCCHHLAGASSFQLVSADAGTRSAVTLCDTIGISSVGTAFCLTKLAG